MYVCLLPFCPSGLVWCLLGSVCCVSVGGQSQHWPRSDKRVWNNNKVDLKGERVSLDHGPVVQCGRGREGGRGQACVGGRVETGWDNLRRLGTWSPSCGQHTSCDPVTCHVTRSQPAYRVGRPGTATRPHRQGTIFSQ